MAKSLNEVTQEILARGDAGEPLVTNAQAAAMQHEAPVEQQVETPVNEQEPSVEQPVQDAPPVEQPAMQQAPVESNALDAILKATEAYQQAQQENAQLKARLAELEAAMQQQSQEAQNTIIEELLEPPKLNTEGFEFLSDEERAQRLAEYNTAMADYTKKQVMREFEPALKYFQQQSKAAEYEAARNALSSAPEFSAIMDDREGIDNVLAKTPEFQSMDPQKQILLAALINKGIKAVNSTTKGPSPEEIANQALQNPEVMRIIETKRAQDIANKNKSLPNIAVNSGMSSVPAMPQDKPKGWDDARDRAKKRADKYRF